VSDGGSHVLFSIPAGGFYGVESRWSSYSVLEFSPNHTYFAISDARYSPFASSMRIFSVADRKQLLVTAEGPGGAWVADDRFVWTSSAGLLQWTPQGGVAAFRPEKYWFGVSSSPDGQWLAGTRLPDTANPHVQIVPVGGGAALNTGLGSGPGFVSPTVVWYIGEKVCNYVTDNCGYDPTIQDGTVHAYDVLTKTDRLVVFRAGEKPEVDGDFYWSCCATRA